MNKSRSPSLSKSPQAAPKLGPASVGLKLFSTAVNRSPSLRNKRLGPLFAKKRSGSPIVVKIAPSRLNPAFRVREAQRIGALDKAVAIVLVKPVRAKIRDVEIQISVAVVIRPSRAVSVAGIGNAQVRGDVGKPVAIIAKQAVGRAEIGDVEIQVPVAVHIAPDSRAAVAGIGDAQCWGDVGKPVTIVAVQAVGFVAADDGQVEIPVAVVIRPGRAKSRAEVA